MKYHDLPAAPIRMPAGMLEWVRLRRARVDPAIHGECRADYAGFRWSDAFRAMAPINGKQQLLPHSWVAMRSLRDL
ncbi:hypothetical protein E1295_47260 [Nonomuraea mesophila]|uniref:Uncharacterized protein n=2 Tax=Nonomuraea mesophila TaxID=2530382 RepID=A0A4R5E2U0_9ACTN|nr:hypothetical protein E1295_47260 [Nonomuraea mesophila]